MKSLCVQAIILFVTICFSAVCLNKPIIQFDSSSTFGVSSYQATDSIPKKSKVHTQEYDKLYCSNFVKTKYKVSISGSKIKITRLDDHDTQVIYGTLKNKKIYSNDLNEKRSKLNMGRYYKLVEESFGVLNIENGDYEWFTPCKQ